MKAALATAGRKLEEMAQLGVQMDENGLGGEHIKAMWAGKSTMLVAVRVRPLMKHDIVKKSCVRVLDSKVCVIMDPASGDKQDILRANRSREKQYAFDYVFEPGSSQESTYHHTAKFLIHGVLDGYNATVFAYGQTGSGKTYTMIGSESEPGIMVRFMGDLFTHSATQGKQSGVQYKVTVSFLEVYNENIRDLLSDVEEYLDLREDPIKGPVVASITEIETTSSVEVMHLLHQGNEKRSQAATAANEVSSRSHAVLQVLVEGRDRAPGTVADIKVGKLSLVDLAGSERAANTKNSGQRLVEGANINRSLLALGNCINALGEKGNKGNFVPYRDSKLTRLLKDSLGGNCRTVMIANISCAESSFEETLNTLKYANRAKNIKTHAQRNVLNVNYHISEYVQLITNLRNEIQLLKGQIGSNENGNIGIAGVSPKDGTPPQPGDRLKPTGFGNGAPSPLLHANKAHAPSTPFHALRESMKSAAGGEGREIINQMRSRIVDNFQERMQLRRSLIELEDQNVQNSIELSKRQLMVVQWSEQSACMKMRFNGEDAGNISKEDLAADIMANGTPEVAEAWQEVEQLRKAISKNNGMKKNIAKRLKLNEKDAEKFREEMGDKITGEDRRELMALQYQVGRLELENMELEQHRIVHESILKGKNLEIQKLKLQLAVKDKIINRQQVVLEENNLSNEVGYTQLALMEQTLMGDVGEFSATMAPPSPPRNMADLMVARPGGMPLNYMGQQQTKPSSSGGKSKGSKADGRRSESSLPVPKLKIATHDANSSEGDDDDVAEEYGVPITDRAAEEVPNSGRDQDFLEHGEWSEIGELPAREGVGNSRVEASGGDLLLAGVGVKGKRDQKSLMKPSQAAGHVHGPRGGRHFRSANNQIMNPIGGDEKGFKNKDNNGNFSIEDSDDDSTTHKGGKRHVSPRRDKLDPIPLIPTSEEGVLSGRKFEVHNAGNGRKQNNAGYAPIHPSYSVKSGIGAGGENEERARKAVAQKIARRNSRGALDDVMNDFYPKFNDDHGLVVKPKAIGNKNPHAAALGKIRAKGALLQQAKVDVGSKDQGDAGGVSGDDFSLNINGFGMGGKVK